MSQLSQRALRQQHTQDRQSGEAQSRLEIVERYRALVDSSPGISLNKAAKRLGVSPASLSRWTRAEAASGFAGLLADLPTGRPSVLKLAGPIDDALAKVKALAADMESNTGAWRAYAQSDECPAAIAEAILKPRSSKHAIPPSLRAATRVQESLLNQHRGPRRASLKGFWVPRRLDILPGDVFSSDDTTPIFAWWVPWPQSDAYPFGKKLLQGQLLPVIDVASQCLISFTLIARETSGYRACDIWSMFGQTFDTIGLPRLGWQLERGTWESNLIAGEKIEYKVGDISLTRRVGGLRQLPTNVTAWHREKIEGMECFPKTLQTFTSFLPKSKSIEASFDRMQSLEGCLWGCLGRDQMRRPFEAAKKQAGACQRGSADPGHHFLSLAELVSRLVKLYDYLNHEPIEGRVFSGVPRVTFDQAIAEHPLFRLPEDQRYLYRRHWAKTFILPTGRVSCKFVSPLTGKTTTEHYCHESFARHEGQEVLVYFDQEDPTAEAQIVLAKSGEYLCDARHLNRPGMFLDPDQSAKRERDIFRASVTALYTPLVPHFPSRQLPPEIAARRQESISGGRASRPQQCEQPAISTSHETPRTNTPASPSAPAPALSYLSRMLKQESEANETTNA